MKIQFDHQIFSAYKYGGVSKYFIELTRGLRKIDGTDTALSCPFSFNEDLLDSHLYPSVKPVFRNYSFKGKGRLFSLINGLRSRQVLQKADFDIFHPTYYGNYFLPYLGKKPFVVTCHDLIHEKFAEKFAGLNEDKKGKAEILKRSDRIIAVSENTKKDILEYYDVDPAKITVIYLAHEKNTAPSSQEPLPGLPEKYLLYVGKRAAYKNFSFFVRAISPHLVKTRALALVCAGGGNFTKEEERLFHHLRIERQVFHTPLNNSNLNRIYKNALAFFFPTLYEGFGIPVLESFSNGCPTVLSHTSSLPEVAGDAALYFDPYDKESIYDAAAKILEDPQLRQSLQKRCLERSALFSWEKTAKETYSVYQEIIK